MPPDLGNLLLVDPPPCSSPSPAATRRLEGRFVLPLALLRKGPLRNFAISEPGGAVSLLHHRENAFVAAHMIAAAATQGGVSPPAIASYFNHFVRIADLDVRDSQLALSEVKAVLGPAPEAWSLATQLSEAFLLLAELFSGEFSRTVTFAYDEHPRARISHWQRVGTKAMTFRTTIPGATLAASYHAELVIPDQLEIVIAKMRPTGPDGRDLDAPDLCAPDTYATRGALYSPMVSGSSNPRIYVTLRSHRSAFFGPSLLLAFATIAALAVGSLFAFNNRLTGHTTTSALFLAPAYVASVVLRSDEQPLVREMLSLARFVLVLITLAGVIAAAALALGVHNGTLRWLWAGTGGAAAVLAWVLAVGWWRSLPDIGGPQPGSPPRKRHIR